MLEVPGLSVPVPVDQPGSRSNRFSAGLMLAGVASLSAGAIHAAAVGAHADHPATAWLFVAVALFQLGWGATALVRPGRAAAIIGTVGNAFLVLGWLVAKTRGLSFISGLEVAEPVQVADALGAALAAIAVGAGAWTLGHRAVRARRPAVIWVSVVVLGAMAVPGMVEAGAHAHGGATPQAVIVGADGRAKLTTASPAVPARPYDPALPIDLGGVAGVTPQQQARAENLVAITLARLPQWSDPASAVAAGYRSIGDGFTGFEHYINWSYLDDGKTLDPDHPESLVYRVRGSTKTLEAAMYMLAPGATLDSVPDVGGALTQWHIHDNLCFTGGAAPQVVGLTDGAGACAAPLMKLQPVPMIHVWIVPTPCGPFSALEGVGAGQIKPGDQRLCDHLHGSAATTGFGF